MTLLQHTPNPENPEKPETPSLTGMGRVSAFSGAGDGKEPSPRPSLRDGTGQGAGLPLPASNRIAAGTPPQAGHPAFRPP